MIVANISRSDHHARPSRDSVVVLHGTDRSNNLHGSAADDHTDSGRQSHNCYLHWHRTDRDLHTASIFADCHPDDQWSNRYVTIMFLLLLPALTVASDIYPRYVDANSHADVASIDSNYHTDNERACCDLDCNASGVDRDPVERSSCNLLHCHNSGRCGYTDLDACGFYADRDCYGNSDWNDIDASHAGDDSDW